MGLTKHPDKPKGECVMEFRDKPMQNLIRIKEKEICKNVQELLLDGEQIVGAYKTVRDQAVFTTPPHFYGGYAGDDWHPAGDLCAALPQDPALRHQDGRLR